jgi:hypothetical protein
MKLRFDRWLRPSSIPGAAKDLDGFLRLWNHKAPNLESRKQETQKLFAEREKIEVKKVTIYKVAMDGERASLRADAEINALEAKTGKPAPGSAMAWKVCVRGGRQGGIWLRVHPPWSNQVTPIFLQ